MSDSKPIKSQNPIKLINTLRNLGTGLCFLASSFELTEEELDLFVECRSCDECVNIGYKIRERRQNGEQVDYVPGQFNCLFMTVDCNMGTVESYLYCLGDFSDIDLDDSESDGENNNNVNPREVRLYLLFSDQVPSKEGNESQQPCEYDSYSKSFPFLLRPIELVISLNGST